MIYDNNNITPKGMEVGASKGKPIKKTKIVTTPNKVKTVEFGPMGSYGKQERTRSVVRKKPDILSRIKNLLPRGLDHLKSAFISPPLPPYHRVKSREETISKQIELALLQVLLYNSVYVRNY